MALQRLTGRLKVFGLSWAAALGFSSAAFGQCPAPPCSQCNHCNHKCPPPYVHCAEGPPKIKFKQGCPKPVCNPCDLPHWGYYQTCWRPWPYPPNWTHCHVPPPGALVPMPPSLFPPGQDGQQQPAARPGQLPTPRPADEPPARRQEFETPFIR